MNLFRASKKVDKYWEEHNDFRCHVTERQPIVLFSFKGTEEIWVIYIGIFRAFCVLRQPMSYMYVP